MVNPSLPAVAGGNNDSSASVISADGRFVLFLSSANNLVTNDDTGAYIDVFLRNRTNNTTTLVSVNRTGFGGGNGHSFSPVISADGRYVAFESEAANLVVGDTNSASDVFVRDLLSGTTSLVSVNLSGNRPGNGASTSPLISSDGRYVAFTSAASDLVTNDTNGAMDVFVRDLLAGTTTLVSVKADGSTSGNGDSDSPTMTPDGRRLAFASKATNLVAGVTNILGEIYVRDLTTRTTIWASTNSSAIMLTVTNAPPRPIISFNPVMSADGMFVAYKSFGTASLLLRQNIETGASDLLSTNAVGDPFGGGDSAGPDMTPEGRYIAFTEASDANGSTAAVYLWDAQTGSRTLVSANLSGAQSTNTYSQTPAVSADGRFVAFVSDATDLATNEVDGSFQVYLRDTVAGTTRLISADLSGGVSTETGGAIPSITADGRYVAFDSTDGNYVTNDDNHDFDVFVRDTSTDTTEIVSQANANVQTLTGDESSTVSVRSLSADGRFVVFVSMADNLTTKVTGGFQNVFLRDLQTGTNILVSINSAGAPSANGSSFSPVISANGRYIAFVSNAGDLAANNTNHIDNIFVRDLQAGTTTLVSVSADGTTGGNAASSLPSLSNDGRYVVFFSLAKNLVPNDLTAGGEIFWRDTQSGTTVAASTDGRASSVTGALSMSDDGRYVAYASGFQGQVHVWDSQSLSNIFTASSGTFGVSYFSTLSSDGHTLIFEASSSSFPVHRSIIAHDLVAGTDRILSDSALLDGPKAQVSANGRFLTFVGAANPPFTPNGITNVFLYDLQTETTTLVSFNHDRTGSGNGTSDSPSISADGRFVTYRSLANDLVTADNNNQADVFVFDRLNGTNTLVSLNQTGTAPGNSFSATPVISADGNVIAFRSLASDLVGGDLNNAEDVFVFRIPRVTLADSDRDGMDDAWERAYFGDLSHNGSDDSDSDGVSDLSEYKAGTDPMNPGSRFRVEATVSVSTGETIMTWEAAPGRSYRVQYTDDLARMIWNDLPGGVGINGSTATCVDHTAAASNQRFYRVTLVE